MQTERKFAVVCAITFYGERDGNEWIELEVGGTASDRQKKCRIAHSFGEMVTFDFVRHQPTATACSFFLGSVRTDPF